MTTSPIQAQVLADLAALGSTAKDISNELQDRNIVGLRDDNLANPIAFYLRALGYSCLAVSSSHIDGLRYGKYFCHETPETVRAFLAEFDAGGLSRLDITKQSNKWR